MAGHVEHTALRIVLVATLEVVLRIDGHIRGRHLDILIVGDVDTRRVVHLVIGTRGDGERRDGPFAMVKHGIHIGREHALVFIIYLHGRVRPPEERLRQRGAVRNATLDLQIGTAGAQGEARHPLLVEHPLHLVLPDRYAPVGILHDGAVHGQVGARTVVLRPVELDAAAYPRPRQAHQCGLDDVVIVHEVALLDLVVRHLDAAAQFGQDHHLDIFVLQVDGLPLLVHFLV